MIRCCPRELFEAVRPIFRERKVRFLRVGFVGDPSRADKLSLLVAVLRAFSRSVSALFFQQLEPRFGNDLSSHKPADLFGREDIYLFARRLLKFHGLHIRARIFHLNPTRLKKFSTCSMDLSLTSASSTLLIIFLTVISVNFFFNFKLRSAQQRRRLKSLFARGSSKSFFRQSRISYWKRAVSHRVNGSDLRIKSEIPQDTMPHLPAVKSAEHNGIISYDF